MAATASRGVALILGTGPGLGLSLAKKFAAKGLVVAAGSRTAAAIEGVKSYAVDATSASDVEKFVSDVESELGPIEVAVFNVGGSNTFVMGSILTLDPAAIERNWRTVCLGGIYFGQAVAKRMVHRSAGTIIFTGATASLRGGAKFAGLAIPKFGLRGT